MKLTKPYIDNKELIIWIEFEDKLIQNFVNIVITSLVISFIIIQPIIYMVLF